MKKIRFGDIAPHLVALVVFLAVTLVFFSPIFFDNKSLDQQDISQHISSAKALRDYRNATGNEGLWAPSMFSGMPAYLVNLEWSDGVVVTMKKMLTLFLPHPVCNIFAAFICYYILLLSFRIRPYLAIAGALAFGLSSYMVIGLSAGHNARIGAIAFMPLVMAGIHLAFTGKRTLGMGVTALGLALQLRENHLQITYYLMMIVGVYGLVQLILAFREKQLKQFFATLGMLIPAAVIAAATFFGQFWAITEYTRYSIRGPSELVAKGAKAQDGLSKSYAFAYNYGIWEPLTLMIPQAYGGSSMRHFVEDQKSESYKALVQSNDNQLANQLAQYTGAYWGPQSFTIGPYYAGAIIVFLFIVGMLFADRKYVWWLVPLSALSLMLSWGEAFSSFNYFMFDYFPGYNKFRSVNFALIIILFAMPLLGFIGVEKYLSEVSAATKKKLLMAFIVAGGACLMLWLFAGMGTYSRDVEAQLPPWFLKALQADRQGLLQDDAIRSFSFIAAVFISLYFNLAAKVSPLVFGGLIVFMVTMDVSLVDKRYFTKDNFHRKRDNTFFVANPSDEAILRDKDYYRVYNLTESFSTGARTSYYHNSLGGYHGAKIRRYQDLYDSCIARETQALMRDGQSGQLDMSKFGVLNMLNTRYIIYGPGAQEVIVNPFANGPAWFVQEASVVPDAIAAINSLQTLDTKKSAVLETAEVPAFQYDSTATVTLLEKQPPLMRYETQSTVNGLVVFSEIYYPKGWRATIDGQEVPIRRADYLLRALEVPAGKHVIEFRFEPRPYMIGNKVSMASGFVLLLLVVGTLGLTLRSEPKGQAAS
jgi:hypothetical protein